MVKLHNRCSITIPGIDVEDLTLVLLNLLNELGKRDKMRGLPSILSLFCNKFNKFNNTVALMLDSIYDIKFT